HWAGRGGNIGMYFGLGFIILYVIGVIVLLSSSMGPGILANPNAPRIFGVSALVVLLIAFSFAWSGRQHRSIDQVEVKREEGRFCVKITYHRVRYGGIGRTLTLGVNHHSFPIFMSSNKIDAILSTDPDPARHMPPFRTKPPYEGYLNGVSCRIYYVQFLA